MKRSVRRVIQSPMNPLRWCLELDCGHDVYVTSKSRPKRKQVPCDKCAESEREQRRVNDLTENGL